jgi:hypothetical protein
MTRPTTSDPDNFVAGTDLRHETAGQPSVHQSGEGR